MPVILQGTGIPLVKQQVTVHLEPDIGEYVTEDDVKFLCLVIIYKVYILVMVIDKPQHITIIYPLIGEERKIKGKAKTAIQAKRRITGKVKRGSFLLDMLKGREYQTLRSGR